MKACANHTGFLAGLNYAVDGLGAIGQRQVMRRFNVTMRWLVSLFAKGGQVFLIDRGNSRHLLRLLHGDFQRGVVERIGSGGAAAPVDPHSNVRGSILALAT